MNSLSSPESSTGVSKENEQKLQRSEHVCAPAFSTTGELLPALIVILLMLVSTSKVLAQTNEDHVVAMLNGSPITLREVDAAATSKLFSLQQQIFALRKVALENLISGKILESEAARRNISVSVLKEQMLGAPVAVDPRKVEEVYAENVSAFGSMSPDEAKEKVRMDLQAHARLKRYREELEKLRNAVQLEILLDEPRFPVARAPLSASKGPADAKVVIIEFSDFLCPYCKEVQTTLRQVLRDYSGKVRLDFRHLPLERHTLSMELAQAAVCSSKQGKFWDFHDSLFAAATLSRSFIHLAASKVGLNLKEFDDCVASSESRAAVVADLQEARRIGIDGTPTFVINGKLLRGAASLEQFKSIIDRELKASSAGSAGRDISSN